MKENLMDNEPYRKDCMKRQTHLRKILLKPDDFNEAIQQLLAQHAMLHTQRMAGTEPWSFEDDILNDLNEEQIRRILHNQEHSIVWNIWHIARIEDVAINLLVAGNPQVFTEDDWLDKMKISHRDTGNSMSQDKIKSLSKAIDIAALREYRLTVGRQTREIINELQPGDLKRKVLPSRLQKVQEQGAVVEAASGLIAYWSRRNIAGLLLMPGTRHNLVHLNETWRLKSMLH